MQKNKVSECITFQSKNGLNVETLEKVVLLQKAAAAISISPDDLSAVMKLQNFLLEAGFSASEIAEAFAEVLGKEDSGVKLLAKQMLAALDHPRVREGDLSVGGQIAKAFDFAAVSFFYKMLRTGVNFTNISHAAFSYKSVWHSFSVITVWVCNFCQKEIGTKAACKLLAKLTTGGYHINEILN